MQRLQARVEALEQVRPAEATWWGRWGTWPRLYTRQDVVEWGPGRAAPPATLASQGLGTTGPGLRRPDVRPYPVQALVGQQYPLVASGCCSQLALQG